jgi:DNA-binding transcriptional regulator GbsR (MarR family)
MEAQHIDPTPRPTGLSPWETATIEVFIHAANLIGLPRSVGEIYGCLFCAPVPQTFDALVARLGISRGSVSQGLKLLRQLGAVEVHYVPGSRKDHYLAELSMKRLVHGFVRDQFAPNLESGDGRLDAIAALIESEADPAVREHAAQRINTLRTWQGRMQKLMPIMMAALGGANFFSQPNEAQQDII